MNVTHFIRVSQRPGLASFSGAENHVFILAKGQKQAGLNVELALLIDYDGPVLAAKAAELREQGVIVHEIKLMNPNWAKRFLNPDGTRRMKLLEFCLKAIARPLAFLKLFRFLRDRQNHVIHTHLNYADVRVRFFGWLAGCRNIVTSFHSNDPIYATFSWRIKLKMLDRITKQTIAISDKIRDYLSHQVGLDRTRITTVYYGINEATKISPKTEIRNVHNIPPDQFVVGFVGRLSAEKNLPLFIKALAQLPDIYGVIIGNGLLEDELRVLADRLGVQNIDLLGHQPDAADIMPAFDLFCLPSRWEGLGLVLLEAMVRGVPIVGSQAGAIPEILGQGQYGLLFDDLDDPQDLVDKIRYALNNPAEIHAKSQNALTYARRVFTVEAMVEKTTSVYLRALQ